MSEEREPYLVLGQEVTPEVPYHIPSGHFLNPDPSDLACIERRHLDRIIELLAAAWAYADDGNAQEARNLLDQVLTSLEEGTWATLGRPPHA